MALEKEDVEHIQSLIQQAINSTPELKNNNVRYELDLRERTIRVEEELKHQRELMIQGFQQMEKRFEQVDKRLEQVDKRFEQVDKRFEHIQFDMNKRFEQVDKRFEQMQLETNKRFEQMQLEMNARFEKVDQHFEQIDKRFIEMGRRLDRFMFWSLGLTISSAVFVVNYLK